MKQLLLILAALCLMMPSAEAQNSKAKAKALKKEFKSKIKEYNKGGWKLYGSSRSIEVVLLNHYEKLEAEGTYEIMGECSAFKSNNVGHQTAVNNASNLYARQAGSKIKGRIVSDMAGNPDAVDGEFDHFYAAYEALVEKEIQGELIESYSVIHDNGNGTKSMRSFFVVSEDAACKARIRAFENAAKESAAAQKYAQKVSDFIREGFEPSAE